MDFGTSNNPIMPPLADIVKMYETEKNLRPITGLTHDIFDDKTLPEFIDHTEIIDSGKDNPVGAPESILGGNCDGVRTTDPEAAPEGVFPAERLEGVPVGNADGRPKRRNVGTYKDGPVNVRKFPINGESYEFAFNINVINDWEHPIPAMNNRGHFSKHHHPTQKINKSFIADCYFMQEPWFEDPTCVSDISNYIAFDT